MAARRKTAPVVVPEEDLVPVSAEEYVEDESWDGTPEVDVEDDGAVAEEEQPVKARRGRVVSPLIVATRAFEAAHKDAVKARAAVAKYQPLIDSLEALEKAEQGAYEALQEELGNLGG